MWAQEPKAVSHLSPAKNLRTVEEDGENLWIISVANHWVGHFFTETYLLGRLNEHLKEFYIPKSWITQIATNSKTIYIFLMFFDKVMQKFVFYGNDYHDKGLFFSSVQKSSRQKGSSHVANVQDGNL